MLTQDEEELYDRQIRLWGVSAQTRIRQSKVLMLGFNGIASEVAKILVLAGIDSLTIVDDQKLQDSDVTSNLFCRPPANGFRTHQVIEKLKRLNPLVKVQIDNTSVKSKPADYYKGYDLVTLHATMTIDEISAINDICRANRIKFYMVLDYGFFGFMFNDLGQDFIIAEKPAESGSEVSIASNKGGVGNEEDGDEQDRPVKKRRIRSPSTDVTPKVTTLPYAGFRDMISMENNSFDRRSNPALFISVAILRFFSKYLYLPKAGDEGDTSKLEEIVNSLKKTLDLDEKVFNKLDSDWKENIYGSLSPVCAVMGGIAGQDMIRALSNKDIPILNTFSFDGLTMSGTVEKIGIIDERCVQQTPVVKDFLEIDD